MVNRYHQTKLLLDFHHRPHQCLLDLYHCLRQCLLGLLGCFLKKIRAVHPGGLLPILGLGHSDLGGSLILPHPPGAKTIQRRLVSEVGVRLCMPSRTQRGKLPVLEIDKELEHSKLDELTMEIVELPEHRWEGIRLDSSIC